jgi:hypothetical protein
MKISFPVRIYLLALILRLTPVFLTRGLGIGLDDMFQYDMLARSIASGNGYRWYAQQDLKLLRPYIKFDLATASQYDPAHGMYTSFRAPLYPSFLALIYFCNGLDFSRFFAARLVQAIFLSAPLAPVTYLICRALFPDRAKTSRLSAYIVAFYPMLLIYPLGLGTENLFFILLICSFLLLLRSIDDPTSSNFFLSGLLLALTALTRSVILPFCGLALIYLIFLHRRKALLAGIAFVLVISPWVIRNSYLHHKFTGIETSMGYNLYLGYHPQGNGSFVFGHSLDLLSIMDDSERDKIGTEKALEFIRMQPERFLPLAVNRLGFFFGLEKRVLMYFYSNNLIGHIPSFLLLAISAILLLPFVVISVSASLGIYLLRWNFTTALFLLLFTAYLLPHVFILSEDRFHLALIPFFCILAAHFWENGFHLLSSRWNESVKGKWVVVFSILCVCLLFLNWGFELSRDGDKIMALFGPNGNQTFFPY